MRIIGFVNRKSLLKIFFIVLLITTDIMLLMSCSPSSHPEDLTSVFDSNQVESLSTNGTNDPDTIRNPDGDYLPLALLKEVHVMLVRWGVVCNYYSIEGLHPDVTDFMEVECEILKSYTGTFADIQAPSGNIELLVPAFFSERIQYNCLALVFYADYFKEMTCIGTDNQRIVKDGWALIPGEYFHFSHPVDWPYYDWFLLDVFDIENGIIRIHREQLFFITQEGFVFQDEQETGNEDRPDKFESNLRSVSLLYYEIPIQIHFSKKISIKDIPKFKDGMTLVEFDRLLEIALAPPVESARPDP